MHRWQSIIVLPEPDCLGAHSREIAEDRIQGSHTMELIAKVSSQAFRKLDPRTITIAMPCIVRELYNAS
jgi:hypothetical protein